MASALDFALGPTQEVVIVGDPATSDTKALLAALRKPYLPNVVVLFRPRGENPPIVKLAPFTKTLGMIDGKATAYVCRNFACAAPTTDVKKMMDLLR